MNSIIKTVDLSKSFFLKKNLKILKKINIEIKKGDLVALLGPSGSGKSTFLHLVALLDQPSYGEIYFQGKKTSEMNESEKDEVRGKNLEDIRITTVEKLANAWESESVKEGIEAFFSKRKPKWDTIS